MSEIKSNRVQIIELIQKRPGIRTPEIVDELQISNPQAYIAGELDRGEVLAQKVQPEQGGNAVNSYRINPDNPPDLTLNPRQRVVKAVGKRQPEGTTACSFALSSRGDLTISDGRKAIQLSVDGTQQLIAYLDRINVDQVMKAAGVA
ncbi:hypothetical protein B7R77_02935 [Ralstonia solanacearum K60]|uniref:Uncharacterized protein n=1 Tax=Ralstonia solanacearum K60 TaxID=1091042 RepID=A0AAP7ZKK0_RALSL|nr:hypothetical protein [Ralstonia solanacearum]OYQ12312.1 hypothetical protein B7R77_02935 [Ralstonia solanacearum K60]CCF96508.1 conserved hypothetical protein [Ralstonia solanacearum K60]